MRRAAIAVALGTMAASLAPAPPTAPAVAVLALVGLVLAAVGPARMAGIALLASSWFLLHALVVLTDRLPATADRSRTSARFCVENFPRQRGRAHVFEARRIEGEGPGRMRLHWYDAPQAPALGECWQLEVVQRTPRGLANAGGFDYERWLFTRRIGATGYVRTGTKLSRPGRWQVAYWRAGLERRLVSALPEDPATAVMVALATGSRHRLDAAAGERFAATGTSHLMAISGLHVGLVAGLVFLFHRIVRLPGGRDGAGALAFTAALAYGLVAGLGVPVRRALVMLATVLLAARWRRPLAPADAISLAFVVVVALQPLDILTPGFALSFGAVASILVILRARGPTPAPSGHRFLAVAAAAVRLQWRLWLLLLPLTLLLFDRAAWASVPANLVAIPAFSFVVVPGTLAGALLSPLAEAPAALLLRAVHAVLRALLGYVDWLAGLPFSDWRPGGTGALALAGLLLAALLPLVPRRLAGRAAAAWLILPVLLGRDSAPRSGCFTAEVIDVGQGLAVLVRTAGRSMLYDTGPAYATGSDAGDRIVLPVLRHRGLRALDLLVVSHADTDHAGGAVSISAAMPVRDRLSGEPGELPGLAARQCVRGQRWQWDGIEFRVLWPGTARGEGNDRSCVLEVSAGERRLLLAGDIESAAERELVAGGRLRHTDVVVVPHHGSATSSSRGFSGALSPAFAVVSAGYNNRWSFPRPEVVDAWRSVGSRILTTSGQGAVRFRFCRDAAAATYAARRVQHRRLWSASSGDSLSGT